MADNKLEVPRYNFSVEIWDNGHKLELASEGFNTDSKEMMIRKLEDIILELKRD